MLINLEYRDVNPLNSSVFLLIAFSFEQYIIILVDDDNFKLGVVLKLSFSSQSIGSNIAMIISAFYPFWGL